MKQSISNKSINILKKHILAVTLCLFVFIGNPIYAQKIKVVKNKKRIYPERTFTIDTLNVEITIKQLLVKELQYYSIAYYSDLPSDFTVLLNPFEYEKKKNKNNVFVFYHLEQSYFNSLNFQNSYGRFFYINPFLLTSGQKKFHVFLLKILNKSQRSIVVNPNLFSAINEFRVKKSIFTFDDFMEHYQSNIPQTEKEKSEYSIKILKDNLFSDEIIYPNTSQIGLICFPINRVNEKISVIRIPEVKFYRLQPVSFEIKM